ncbi:2-C-methyl-D-erythritol 4-phosphate cytidylyltransferase [Rhodanobacter sp. Si-c]|uniref:2-C-methyl-D-erythritol 4-phosphate cytidylyltransferase n=1 Tax=Rhodanobacter lycopersici TaxID=3162487 RepID=A0ABV3QBE7_9GAMM
MTTQKIMTDSTQKNVPCIAIVLASGTGTRFRSETPKQFLKLAGKTVLEHTIDVFEQHVRIDEIIIVVSADSLALTEAIVNNAGYRKVTRIVIGGATRRASSASGIVAITGDDHKVLVHDAVRPLLDRETIDRCVDALDVHDAVDTGIPSPDTIIRLADDESIVEIPDRSRLRLGQTPQAFRAGLLRKAHALASTDDSIKVTDDCGLILHYGLDKVHVVAGDVNNIKVTYPSDIYLADRLFQLRTRPMSGHLLTDALHDKVLIVFGASRGIGQSITTIARAAGAQVIPLSRSTGTDITDVQNVRKALVEAMYEHGRIDLVANTAGILRTGLLAGQGYDVIDEQLATNLRGSIIVAREAFEVMHRNGGSISLFTSSSYTRGRARSAIYSATKAAVVNLMQGLAQEFLPFGVRINAINPERTATPMRTENFGNESLSELLDPDTVAQATLEVMLSEATGEVVDVRR